MCVAKSGNRLLRGLLVILGRQSLHIIMTIMTLFFCLRGRKESVHVKALQVTIHTPAISLGAGLLAAKASMAAVRKSMGWRRCWRQVSRTVSRVST